MLYLKTTKKVKTKETNEIKTTKYKIIIYIYIFKYIMSHNEFFMSIIIVYYNIY